VFYAKTAPIIDSRARLCCLYGRTRGESPCVHAESSLKVENHALLLKPFDFCSTGITITDCGVCRASGGSAKQGQ
jgi:hypothetical protein